MDSTVGTMLALIEAVKKADAVIVDIVCAAEKVGCQGVSQIQQETGHEVKT